MTRLRLALVLLLALAAAPAVADDAPATGPHPDRAARAAAWAERYAALTRTLPVDPAVAEAGRRAVEEGGAVSVLVPAGDLDGDGGSDFADLRLRETYDDVFGFAVEQRAEIRRGRDGALLWTKQLPRGFGGFVFTKVGAKGVPGALAIAYSSTGTDQLLFSAGGLRVTVEAVDGAGRSLWSTADTGGYAGSLFAGSSAGTWVDAVGDLVPGGGTDVLVSTAAGGGAADPTYTVWREASATRYGVVDGATGTVTGLGAPIPSSRSTMYPAVVGDLDGDRRGDVAAFSDEYDAPALRAIRSSDGAALWTQTAFQAAYDYYVYALPDVTGDGVADVAVLELKNRSTVVLVDGRSGRVVWRKNGDTVDAIGDADRRRGSEVAVMEQLSNGAGFTAAAYTGAGRAVWSVTRRVSVSGGQGYKSGTSYGVIGDVHGDGVADVGYAVVVLPLGAKERRDDGVVDGRTGRVRRDPAADMRPLEAPVDGRGTDAAVRRLSQGVLTVEAWRGDRPSRLWRSAVALGPGATEPGRMYSVRADRDRCAEVVVTAEGTRTITVVLSGATGAPAWVLTRAGDAAGVVSRPKARSLTRYARTC